MRIEDIRGHMLASKVEAILRRRPMPCWAGDAADEEIESERASGFFVEELVKGEIHDLDAVAYHIADHIRDDLDGKPYLGPAFPEIDYGDGYISAFLPGVDIKPEPLPAGQPVEPKRTSWVGRIFGL